MDLRFRQGAGARREQRRAQMEGVAREFQVEEGRLGLFELARRRQHIVGVARGLGHGHVDHHRQLQGAHGFAHALAIGQRMQRVAGLHQHGAIALGMVGEDFLWNHVAGNQADDDLGIGHRAALLDAWRALLAHRGIALAGLGQREEGHEGVAGAGAPVMAGEQPDQALQVAAEGRVQVHLHAQVFQRRYAAGAGDTPGGGAQLVFRHPAGLGAVGHRDGVQFVDDVLVAAGVLGQPVARQQPVLDDDPDQRRQAPGVGARTDLQVEVGQGGGFAQARVDHDDRARGVLGHGVEQHAGAGETMGLPGILADQDGHLAMLEVAVHAGTEHLALDPELAGLFLGQGVGAVLHPEGLQRAVAVGAAEVVALRAAAVVEDAFAAMPALDGEEFLRHLADRRVPVDGFVAAIGAPAHRRVQAVGAVLVVVHALRFLADVALRGGVVVIAADLADAAILGLHFQPAVEAAEDTGGLLPLRGRRSHGVFLVVVVAGATWGAPQPCGLRSFGTA